MTDAPLGDLAGISTSAPAEGPLDNIPFMHKKYQTGLMWFRRDLRVEDNAALYQALKSCRQVVCVFIFDREILDNLPRADRRVEFIRESLTELDEGLRQLAQSQGIADAGLIVLNDVAHKAVPLLASQLDVQAVFANHDYEPAALDRDATVRVTLETGGKDFHTFKDQVIFERAELLTLAGKPYSVFTPYKNAWLKKVDDFYLKPYPVEKYADAFSVRPMQHRKALPTLGALGFEPTNLKALKILTGSSGGAQLLEDFSGRMQDYDVARNFPAVKGPSYLGVHLRFGTVSVRKLAGQAFEQQKMGNQGAEIWLSELIWRDFYAQILSNFPHVATAAFKPAYDLIAWEQGSSAEALFQAWCQGLTGYPLVDAAMAQINQTGYMHNRLRMVVASFMVKDLGLDWRWGERYFAEKLNDFDLSSNNGGWQWAASSGCDAQPYFRIFNPLSQSEKFDSEGKFICRYLPVLQTLSPKAMHSPWLAKPEELAAAGIVLGENYPHPIVRHEKARALTLQRYSAVKGA